MLLLFVDLQVAEAVVASREAEEEVASSDYIGAGLGSDI